MKSGTKTTLRVVAWSASTVLLVGAAAGTATAATHHAKHKKGKHATSSDTSTTTDTAPRAGGPGGPGGPGMNAIHGVATVENSDGTFETYASQNGEVTAVSATSITVVSDDEYSATYAIDDDTVVVKDGAKGDVSDVATGDTVFVRAEQESDGATADVIGDGRPPAGQGHPGGPGGRGPGGPPPAAGGESAES